MPLPNTPPLRLLERPPRRAMRSPRTAPAPAPQPGAPWVPEGLRRVWRALRSAT